MNKAILKYIEENRGFDTSDNITRKLISQGYNFAEIQAVWESVEVQKQPKMTHPRKPPKAVSPYEDAELPNWIFTALKVIFLIVVGIIFLLVLIVVLTAFTAPNY